MAFNGVVAADRADTPSYGLFSAARVQNRGSGDEHWIGGYNVESDLCGLTVRTLPLCESEAEWYDLFDSSDSSRYFHVPGFGILETYGCDNSVGFNARDDRATVIRQLKSITEYAVESELWHGHLAQGDADINPTNRWLVNAERVGTGAGLKPKVALALVEQAFATNNPGVQATIHMTPLMAAVIEPAFEQDGDSLITQNGSLVYINRGGDGSEGPASGGSDTAHWIYATGPVHVDLGSDELITVSKSDIVNARDNSVLYAAERPAAVYFDGCSWYGALADATL